MPQRLRTLCSGPVIASCVSLSQVWIVCLYSFAKLATHSINVRVVVEKCLPPIVAHLAALGQVRASVAMRYVLQ